MRTFIKIHGFIVMVVFIVSFFENYLVFISSLLKATFFMPIYNIYLHLRCEETIN